MSVDTGQNQGFIADPHQPGQEVKQSLGRLQSHPSGPSVFGSPVKPQEAPMSYLPCLHSSSFSFSVLGIDLGLAHTSVLAPSRSPGLLLTFPILNFTTLTKLTLNSLRNLNGC